MVDFGLGVALDTMELWDKAREWRNDPKIWRWTRQNDLISEAQHFAWFDAQTKDPAIKMYSIREDARVVGVCGLTGINLANRNAEFSLYIATPFQGCGLGKKALLTLLAHGFRNLGLRSIWGETFANNPAQKTFREIGMQEDGIRRQFYFKDGEFWDAILFSILDDEFFELHGEKSCFG